MTLSPGVEYRRALGRVVLLATLVASWGAYAAGLTVSSGRETLKNAFARPATVRPRPASVSWIEEGAPLPPKELLRRAEGGTEKTGDPHPFRNE